MRATHNKPVAICPYCEHVQPAVPSSDIKIALCNPDDGGCDRYFAHRCIETRVVSYITQSSTLVLSDTIPQLTTTPKE